MSETPKVISGDEARALASEVDGIWHYLTGAHDVVGPVLDYAGLSILAQASAALVALAEQREEARATLRTAYDEYHAAHDEYNTAMVRTFARTAADGRAVQIVHHGLHDGAELMNLLSVVAALIREQGSGTT